MTAHCSPLTAHYSKRMTITEKYSAIESRDKRAASLNKLLLKLAKTETDKDLRIAIKDSIKAINHKIFGHTIAEIKATVRELLNEYYSLELVDLCELSGVHEKQMNSVLQMMEDDNLIVRGKRRRWQEMGKHYNDLFSLVK